MEEKPQPVTTEWQKKDRSAKAAISLSVEDDQLIHIRKLETAKEMWNALKAIHERSNLSNKLYLLRKLYKVRFEKGADMRTHLNGVLEMVDQLRTLGEEIKDNHVAALLLSSLPETYDSLITALEARPESEISLELVKGKLMDEASRREENRLEDCSKDNERTALKVNHEFGNKWRESRICYHCNKPGHLKRDCRILKGQRDKFAHTAKLTKADESTKGMNVSYKNDSSEEEFCFSVMQAQNQKNWYVDSGATAHMTNDKTFFETLSDMEKPDSVKMADGKPINISGMGNGYLYCKSSSESWNKIMLKDVLYVPNLKGSLLSVKRLTNLGYTVKFTDKACEISKDKVVVTEAPLKTDLYQLQCNLALKLVNDHNNCIHIWHQRLGHRDPKAILKLNEQNMARGIKLSDCKIKQTCITCIKGKMTRGSFPKESQNRSTKPYELIHTDVCGPMHTETPGGKRYFITFIDDYSRYTEVYLLKNKFEVEEKLKIYLARANNMFNRKLVTLRSDGGGEYSSHDIDKYLMKEGIKRQTTVPYSPEKNGVAERKNRSIVEMAKCMLIDSSLPNKYWGEAVVTAVYMQNRMPHSACMSTPYEMWHNKVPEIGHIRIFGSRSFIHVPKERRKKLDDKAIEGRLVGYSERSKGYRILIPETNKIIISRSIIFDEMAPQAVTNIENDELKNTEEELEVSVPVENIEKWGPKEENIQQPTQLRRSNRINFGVPAPKLTYVAQISSMDEPQSWEDTQKLNPHIKENWNLAINEEMMCLQKNKTWDLVDLPKGKRTIGCKWVFKTKYDINGDIDRYKARLVAKGFSQKFGIDYDSVFAPVVKYTTVRSLLAITAQRGMKTCHMDVCSAFLYGNLKEEIYMEQPEGQIEPGNEGLVCRLNKCIYGLRQSANEWNKKLHGILSDADFIRGQADQCLYTKLIKDERTYILIYVDDILICSDSDTSLNHVKNIFKNSFEMKDLGEIKLYLGIQIERDINGNFYLNQKNKIQALIVKFKLEDANCTKTPMECDYLKTAQDQLSEVDNNLYRQGVGALLYLATVTRPDIFAAVNFLGRKVSNPSIIDWKAMKRVIRYLKGTMNLNLFMCSNNNNVLSGYADADWAEDIIDRKSTSGCVFMLGNSLISWTCKKQPSIALSTTEAEYMALAMACQEALWLRQLAADMKETQTDGTTLYEDNQSCIKLAIDQRHSNRTKHIDVKFHLVNELYHQGIIALTYCPSQVMLADIMTKPLPAIRFNELVEKLGMTNHISCVGVLDKATE